ncbi:MAG: VOC family protein [Halioglobus sp.]
MDDSIDHLVFATNDLQKGIDRIEALLGLSTVPGGSHPGMGTRNALLALGPKCYLEIIGPDPEQSEFQGTRIFGIDTIGQGKLVHWCIGREGLTTFVQQMKSLGMKLSDVIPMSRVTEQGNRLDWELAFLTSFGEEPALPFFIDWGSSTHPASECPEGAELKRFEIRHPDPEIINGTLKALSIEACAVEDSKFGLYALIKCPRGEVELF